MKTRHTRAFSALILSGTLVVAGCSSSNSTTASSSTTADSTTPASTGYVPTTAEATPAPLPDAERWQPAKHLAADAGWSGVPSGLVYENGSYHVFYPHNPTGDDAAGAVDWAHATSPDLVTWTEQPVAIAGSDDDQVLSGSVVIDQDNTSGLGSNAEPPLVALYTGNDDGQSLAYSTDHGQTWTEYSDNPVLLPRGSAGLQDPKVVWYEEGGYWVLVAAAADFSVQFYKSENLTDWTYLSEFTGAGVQDGAWGSPDLFPLPLDGDEDDIKWVLPVSVRSGAVAGGSGVQYFVGSFDGTGFEADPLGPAGVGAVQPGEMFSWMDWGTDFYGAGTISGAPDGRTLAVGWLNNWNYAEATPTSPWRGSMTLPRELSLATVDGIPRLQQTVPTEASTALAAPGPAFTEATITIPNGSRKLDDDASGTNLDITATLVPGDGAVAGVTVLGSATGQRGTRIQYVKETGILQIDRTNSGRTDLPGFAPGAAVAVPLTDGALNLHIVVDGSGVEVFAGDGKVALSALAFPAAGDDKVAVFSGGGKATINNLVVTQLGA
ncbi:MAG: glycoside hydrolase family 32 protein [Nakamurella sp.]